MQMPSLGCAVVLFKPTPTCGILDNIARILTITSASRRGDNERQHHKYFSSESDMAESQNNEPQGPSDSASRPEFPNGVPSKFDRDGNVQHFPGNTILCHLSPSSSLYASLLVLHKKLEDSPFAGLITLLPPASWHMTVFEGVCDQVRKPGFWPSDLAPDAALAECDVHFERKLRPLELSDGGGVSPPPYRVQVVGVDPLEVGIGLTLQPMDEDEGARIRGLRDRLSGLLLIRHPQHAEYGLHLSMAYLLRHLTADQERELRALVESHFDELPVGFELGAPEFCRFKDMFAFERVMYLSDQ
ncbi:hypothetical protein MAPG_01552 [Magnaporthiopsis poae ATCC 64411]|uniref:DUF1868 domain-containing protein n=1 Tax=Magnaporthiopsis poae (strain ATCC 64411 / 73-15) TaxID=644358 RepID=A0A0C4DP03_MAGP6|nr:hypothetical protein MAPG_01552 [Magnaporthiopsis poae ATCC 64411]